MYLCFRNIYLYRNWTALRTAFNSVRKLFKNTVSILMYSFFLVIPRWINVVPTFRNTCLFQLRRYTAYDDGADKCSETSAHNLDTRESPKRENATTLCRQKYCFLILGSHKYRLTGRLGDKILDGCAQYFQCNYWSPPLTQEYSVYQLRSAEQKALITDLIQFTPEFWVLSMGPASCPCSKVPWENSNVPSAPGAEQVQNRCCLASLTELRMDTLNKIGACPVRCEPH
jgi:hypothetical protein